MQIIIFYILNDHNIFFKNQIFQKKIKNYNENSDSKHWQSEQQELVSKNPEGLKL